MYNNCIRSLFTYVACVIKLISTQATLQNAHGKREGSLLSFVFLHCEIRRKCSKCADTCSACHCAPRHPITTFLVLTLCFVPKSEKKKYEQGSLVPHSKCVERKRRNGVSPSSPKPQNTVIDAETRAQLVAVQWLAACTHNPTHILHAVQQRIRPARKQPAKSPSHQVLSVRGKQRPYCVSFLVHITHMYHHHPPPSLYP